MTNITFNIFKEMKDTTTGKSTWGNVIASIGPINAEDISVTTTSEKLVTKESNKPKIIPFGVKGQGGRVLSFVGTIQNRSMTYQVVADTYFDVLQKNIDDELGYAVSVTSGNDKLPEFGPPSVRWRVEQFNWDRAARQMGQWRFNMTLGYVWDPTLNEIKLYANNASYDIPDNVKFRALIGLNNGGYNHPDAIIINNPKITTSILQLNKATFTCANQTFSKDDIIHIYCQTDPDNAIFFGIINEAPKSSNFVTTYNCIEIGELLNRVMCAKFGSRLFKPRVKIPNPYKGKYLNLRSFVALIMNYYNASMIYNYDPKWGNDMTYKWGEQPYIPYDPSVSAPVYIPAQVLSGMSIYKALTRLLEDQCGMYIWFDNNNGTLQYGFIRNQITIDPAKDIILMSEPTWNNTEDYVPNNVLLYNNEGNYVVYPNPPINGTYISYQYNSSMNNIMMDSMVKKIHNDLQTDRSTFKVRFPAGVVKFKDGDVFTGIGDSTTDPIMPYRDDTDYDPLTKSSDTVWQIKDMTITSTYTEVVVGPSYFSIFDIFRNTLVPVKEAPIPTELVEKYTGEVPISTQAMGSVDHVSVI